MGTYEPTAVCPISSRKCKNVVLNILRWFVPIYVRAHGSVFDWHFSE